MLCAWSYQYPHRSIPPDQSFSIFDSAALNYFLNNKAKVTMRKSYGFRTYRGLELAL